ncbi:MAG: Hsp20/alpha crystallin family protein [Deltaproteobacteria bacterium]|jgi:HSP20 family protein|nr:Hsp20/alpha crystallin family protein [Deltaproteobacteria bacterium]
MAVVRWKPGFFGWHRDPFTEVDRLRREVDNLFGAHGRGIASTAGVFPALNLSEDEDNLYVRAELPGVVPEEIEITTKENNLIIKGERKIAAEGEKVSYHRREREAGSFRRIISLPTRVDAEKVTAVCKNGVLTVTLPRAAELKPRKIEVAST